MREYVTDALVLAKEPLRGQDGRYYFFTQKFGRIGGKATSSRKITSKLAGHLEPGTFAKVRFVERNGGGRRGGLANGGGFAQIADALKSGRSPFSPFDLGFLNRILADNEPDEALWEALFCWPFSAGAGFPWRAVLAHLGWNPLGASCEICGGGAEAFFAGRQEFFCGRCASKFGRNELILLNEPAAGD